MISAGIRSLAVAVPRTVRNNTYYRNRFPDLAAQADQRALAALFKRHQAGPPTSAFDIEMDRFVEDPFRGTVERRVLAPGETALSLEARAARDVLEALRMRADDVDAAIVCSFLPDQIGIGNATMLAKELGLRGLAWNLETACSGALVALQNATALVRAGEYRNVLVVVSCTYSRVIPEDDTLGWFMGDAAGAFLIGAVADGEGVLGTEIVPTTETCGTFYYDLADRGAGAAPRIQCTRETGRILATTSEGYLRRACDGALRRAGLSMSDVDFFTFNTPTAWFAPFCARALGIPMSKTIDRYAQYANIGTALMPVNLFHAASEGLIRRNDIVLTYTIGSVSTAAATVMRWGDVPLGPAPSRHDIRFED